ncbi:MAG: shikimate dehydrogenase [Candidatus Omnitrophica bacterium]|nr:shikimate dehydrogenase [Candidatus Omnitrophota bacterium]
MEHRTTYGLVGYPLGHSLSPLMHNAAFEALGVEARYELFPLRESELEGFFAAVKDAESPIFGFNVTVPYKEMVLKYMDHVSPLVEKIRAVNTVVVTPKRTLAAHNTDAPGFLAHLQELGFEPADRRIALLGAGGAARAIVGALGLLEKRPRRLTVYDVDTAKTEMLVSDLGGRIKMDRVEVVHSIDDLNIPDADLLINATPIGLKPTDPVLVEADMMQPGMLVYDLIYNPRETKLLKMAKARGAKTADGLGMLYYQGVLAFQHWADLQLDDSVKKLMREALEKGKAI